MRSSCGTCALLICLAVASAPQLRGEPDAPRQNQPEKADSPMVLVGAAKVDITPDFPVRLTGYGNRTKESEGVAQRIWARALAIGGRIGGGSSSTDADNDQPAILLTADN